MRCASSRHAARRRPRSSSRWSAGRGGPRRAEARAPERLREGRDLHRAFRVARKGQQAGQRLGFVGRGRRCHRFHERAEAIGRQFDVVEHAAPAPAVPAPLAPAPARLTSAAGRGAHAEPGGQQRRGGGRCRLRRLRCRPGFLKSKVRAAWRAAQRRPARFLAAAAAGATATATATIGSAASDFNSFSTMLDRTCVTPGSLKIVSCRHCS